MGRTHRNRRKKTPKPINLGKDEEFLPLVQWLSSQGWKPTCHLSPAIFTQTGRGLMAKKNIKIGTTLVKIPFNLLITVKTVSESILGLVLNNLQIGLTTQQVLTLYLIYEKHLNSESKWFRYISSLPQIYYSPVFCSQTELDNYPQILQDKVFEMSTLIQKSFIVLNNIFESKKCPHCNIEYNNLINIDIYKWAWFTVNSRCVYISPDINFDHNINLIDLNCLALAPYLDMINHSNEAKVNAFFNLKDSTYTVTTSIPFKKYQQVFINYGSHSNLKLYIEYGFLIHQNHHDIINLSSNNILNASLKINPSLKTLIMTRYDYLKNHNFLIDLSCSAHGFSWNAKITLFVLSAPASANLLGLNRQIFSGNLLHKQTNFVKLARVIVNEKLGEINMELKKIKDFETKSSSIIVKMCIDLMEEYLSILNIVNKELNLS